MDNTTVRKEFMKFFEATQIFSHPMYWKPT